MAANFILYNDINTNLLQKNMFIRPFMIRRFLSLYCFDDQSLKQFAVDHLPYHLQFYFARSVK